MSQVSRIVFAIVEMVENCQDDQNCKKNVKTFIIVHMIILSINVKNCQNCKKLPKLSIRKIQLTWWSASIFAE